MATVKDLTSSQTALCGSIYVEDTTVYGSVAQDMRSNFGIALFVGIDAGSGTFENDPLLSNLSNPGADGIAASWDIDIPNSKTQAYQITAFWAMVWESKVYSIGDIVFYDGYFYTKSAIGTGTEVPGVYTEWLLLTEDDFSLFEYANDVVIENVSSNVVYESVVGCPSYRVVFKECDHKHRVIDNSENQNAKQFSVTRYDGTVVEEAIVMVDNYVEVHLPEDGIYILIIDEETSPGYFETVAKLPIYEYCSFKQCALYLMNSVLCNNDDPCCSDCDEDSVKKHLRQRQTLNQLFFLYGNLLSYIHEESIQYLGIIEMGADRLTYMERIDNLFDKIKLILQRCELCSGAWQETSQRVTNNTNYKPCNC